jgi:hypothetical protein
MAVMMASGAASACYFGCLTDQAVSRLGHVPAMEQLCQTKNLFSVRFASSRQFAYKSFTLFAVSAEEAKDS